MCALIVKHSLDVYFLGYEYLLEKKEFYQSTSVQIKKIIWPQKSWRVCYPFYWMENEVIVNFGDVWMCLLFLTCLLFVITVVPVTSPHLRSSLPHRQSWWLMRTHCPLATCILVWSQSPLTGDRTTACHLSYPLPVLCHSKVVCVDAHMNMLCFLVIIN